MLKKDETHSKASSLSPWALLWILSFYMGIGGFVLLSQFPDGGPLYLRIGLGTLSLLLLLSGAEFCLGFGSVLFGLGDRVVLSTLNFSKLPRPVLIALWILVLPPILVGLLLRLVRGGTI